ncbi:MAG TPA: hypothetical protein PKD32_12005 [Saprospiraceae bacterium]|nr:hypothetical protein [Saprospiraceae bacterium]
MLKSEKKKCEICSSEIFGRSDKRFCSDSCRALFHQNEKRPLSALVKKTNKVLLNNYKILSLFNPDGKKIINRDRLEHEGYSFEFMTQIITTKKGNQYTFCYDQGFMQLEDGKLILVKREPKSDKQI